MKKIYYIRQILVSIMVILILTWAFIKNQIISKIIISPFLICSISVLGENLFLILNKEKIANIFKKIFNISFFVYIYGFLAYATYYVIVNKSYSLFIIIGIFFIGSTCFFKKTFFNKK